MTKKQETMLHPFTKVSCEVVHLQPGETIQHGDVYRSATIAEDGSAITPETGGLGRWFHAPDVVVGSSIHPECNVHFMRLLPLNLHPELDVEMSDEEHLKHLLAGGHAVE